MDPKGGTLVQWPEEDLLYFSSGGWGKIAHFYTTTEGLYIYYFLSITNISQLWVSCTLLRSFAMPLQVSLGFCRFLAALLRILPVLHKKAAPRHCVARFLHWGYAGAWFDLC